VTPRGRDMLREVYGVDVLGLARALVADPRGNGQRAYLRLALTELADGLYELLTEDNRLMAEAG
jgi:hypothetical protein